MHTQEKWLFLFFDWWPTDSCGDKQYAVRMDKLRRNVKKIKRSVDVVYVPRVGEIRRASVP